MKINDQVGGDRRPIGSCEAGQVIKWNSYYHLVLSRNGHHLVSKTTPTARLNDGESFALNDHILVAGPFDAEVTVKGRIQE